LIDGILYYKKNSGYFYAVSKDVKGKFIYLHRFIFKIKNNIIVYYINDFTLDNNKFN